MKMESSSQDRDRLQLGFITLPVKSYSPPPQAAVDKVPVEEPQSQSEDTRIIKESRPEDAAVVIEIAKFRKPERKVQSSEKVNDDAVAELKKRDREVRAHEQAHASALGPYKTGSPQYYYAVGPDGQRYAVGGEVSVDLSPEEDPAETVKKMQAVKRAALAPTNPSSADRAVAARASALEAQAKAQAREEESESSADLATEKGAVSPLRDLPEERQRGDGRGGLISIEA